MGMPPVIVEGVIVSGGEPDADGDAFDIEGARYKEFLECGYINHVCGSTSVKDIIGQPLGVERDGDSLKLRAQVFDADMQNVVRSRLRNMGDGRWETSMGMAMAGIINKREDGKITDFEIRSVALVPADKLTDPRCRCYLVKEEPRDSEA